MQRDERAYLQDVVDACAAIESALAGVDFDEYRANRILRSAVEREFITIGEATAALSHLSSSLFTRLTNGRRIIDFRNQLTHEYSRVDDRIVWLIARDDVPVLRGECDALLKDAGSAV
jgi:uncharacterized protein with HEPN domain